MVTKEQFKAYKAIQTLSNSLHIGLLTPLSKEVYLDIIKNYGKYAAMYNK